MSSILTRLIRLPIACAIAFTVATAAADDPLPKGWEPDLQAAFDMLEDELKDAPQQGINRITARQADLRDAELAIVYLKLHAKLPAKDQATLHAEQTKWLAQRLEQAKEAAKKYEGGSAASMEANLTFIKITAQRTAQLQKRLAALKSKR